jgi:hypothetical protein
LIILSAIAEKSVNKSIFFMKEGGAFNFMFRLLDVPSEKVL